MRGRSARARSGGRVGLLLALVLGGGLSGCQKPAPPVSSSAPPMSGEVRLDTPAQTVRSLLHFLDLDREAIARKDLTAAAVARDQVIWHVAARDQVVARHTAGGGAPRDPNKLIERAVESWSAMVAFYDQPPAFEQLTAEPAVKADQLTLRVPLRSADSTALLRVTMTQADGRWRVRSLDFADRRQPAGPTTQAATMSATAPATAAAPATATAPAPAPTTQP